MVRCEEHRSRDRSRRSPAGLLTDPKRVGCSTGRIRQRGGSAWGTVPFRLQPRVPGEDLEIVVVVEDAGILSDGDRGDQAVHQRPHRRALGPARPGRSAAASKSARPRTVSWGSASSLARILRMLPVAPRPGEQLHDHGLGRRDRRAPAQMMSKGDVSRVAARRRARSTPTCRRGSPGGTRVVRSSSRSPSHRRPRARAGRHGRPARGVVRCGEPRPSMSAQSQAGCPDASSAAPA